MKIQNSSKHDYTCTYLFLTCNAYNFGCAIPAYYYYLLNLFERPQEVFFLIRSRLYTPYKLVKKQQVVKRKSISTGTTKQKCNDSRKLNTSTHSELKSVRREQYCFTLKSKVLHKETLSKTTMYNHQSLLNSSVPFYQFY